MRAFVVALLVAAVACGSAAAAAIPVLMVSLHARLAPVAGTTATGQFNGSLSVTIGSDQLEPSDNLPNPGRSQLFWKLSLPPLRGPISASLRLHATTSGSAAPAARVLCSRCSTTANGTLSLTVAQGLRIARSGAMVIVRTPSATLRGAVKVSPQMVALSAR
jgi:hypothetical protein